MKRSKSRLLLLIYSAVSFAMQIDSQLIAPLEDSKILYVRIRFIILRYYISLFLPFDAYIIFRFTFRTLLILHDRYLGVFSQAIWITTQLIVATEPKDRTLYVGFPYSKC